MAEFKEISSDAPVVQKVTNWFENRLPSAFYIYKRDMAEYPRTSTGGTSLARWPCWSW
jgi:hypothetical protein